MSKGFEPCDRSELATYRGKHSNDVMRFIESGAECARKEYGNRDDAKTAYISIRGFAKRHNLPLKISMRGTFVYITRED